MLSKRSIELVHRRQLLREQHMVFKKKVISKYPYFKKQGYMIIDVVQGNFYRTIV